MDRPIPEPGFFVRPYDPDSLSVRLETSQKGVPSGIETESTQVEMGLGGRKGCGGDHRTAVSLISAHFR
jgi:hypothetical protein